MTPGAVTFPPAGADPDGADRLFEQLDGRPETYRNYALEYFETTIDVAAISRVYRHEPLSVELLSALNPELSLADIAADLDEIGYPGGTRQRTVR